METLRAMIKSPLSSSPRASPIFVRLTHRLLIFLLLLILTAITSVGQVSLEEFRNTLGVKIGLTDDDWSTLKRGRVVVGLLPVADKREVRIYGLARMEGTPEVIVKAFQESIAQRNRESVLAEGKFSNPPTDADVRTLSLESRDIEDLKQCVVGRCELKMSAAMIERFQREVTWDSLNYRSQANSLFRAMLMDYVRNYQTRGAAALIEYHDQRRAVSLRDEQEAFLEGMLYVHDFAPEFATYLKRFPFSELSNVESHINWTKLKFGLKPVIIITHVMTYKPPTSPQLLIVPQQIYANHYFDSSLAMTAVINISTSTGMFDSYLLHTNYSRSDSLTGSFSRVRRGLVETESVENLNALLQQTRTNLHVAAENQSGSDANVRKHPINEWVFTGVRSYAWLVALFGLGVLIFLNRRKARKTQRSADPTS